MPYVLRRDMLRVRDSNGEYIELDTMKGDTGETGQKGDTGETGATPHFTVGTVSTGAPGTPASVSITGTDENPVLNMSIPKGDTGETGQKGETGETGATPHFTIGTVTTGLPGTDASAEITGTDEEPVLNMTIPRGNPGEVTEEELSVVEEGLSHKADSIRDEATGDIVSINSELTATLEEASFEFHPVQDLHGQEYPYPAGGGKNLLNPDTFVEGNYYIYSATGGVNPPTSTDAYWKSSNFIPVTPGEVLYFGEINAAASVAGSAWYDSNKQYISGFTASVLADNSNRRTVPENAAYLRHSFRIDEGYNTDWENTVYITLNTNPHEWSPYENICPISGHTRVDATRTGKNLFDGIFEQGAGNSQYLAPTRIRAKNTIPIKAGYKYTLSASDYTNFKYVINTGATKDYPWVDFQYCNNSAVWKQESITFTATRDGYLGVIVCKPDQTNIIPSDVSNVNIQVEVSSTASTYEPYNGQSVTYQLGHTVYDGVLTINEYGSGQIVSKYASVDMSKLSWSKNWSGDVPSYLFYSSVIGNAKAHATSLCECYKTEDTPNPATLTDKSEVVHINKRCYVKDSSFTTADDLKSFLAGQHLVYELTTPVIIPLSQQEVLTLIEGQNYIWHDANGNTTVIYRVDTKEYVDNKVAEVESSVEQLDAKIDSEVNALDLAKANAIVNSASGSIASFSDGAAYPIKQTVFEMNPVQDLHGQEYPYPAGGSANKWNEEWETGRISWSGVDYNDSNCIRSKGFIPVSEGNVYKVVTSNNLQFFYYDSNKSFVSHESSSKANNTTITIPAGCAYIRFYTYGSAYGGTYKNDIAINFPSTVATYSPYSNNCPILGHTEVDVVRTGKNLFKTELTSQTKNGITYTVNTDGTIQAIGTASAQSIVVIGSYKVKEDGTYFFSGCPSGGSMSTYRIYLSWGSNDMGNGGSQKALTAGTTVSVQIAITSGVTIDAVFKPMLCKLSDGKDYEPYSGQSVTYQLGQTVYGGTLVINEDGTGTMTATHIKVPAPTERATQWVAYSSCAGYYINTNNLEYPMASGSWFSDPMAMCNAYKKINSYSASAGVGVRFGNNNGVIYFANVNDVYPTREDWVAHVAETGIEFCYPLAESIVISLTEQEVIETLYGNNNIWHSANGDTYVEYRCDTKTYVDGLVKEENVSIIAPIETGTTASQAYAAGKYFLLDGKFCKAKTSIASGATFTLNTNYEVTTLADELFTAINS